MRSMTIYEYMAKEVKKDMKLRLSMSYYEIEKTSKKFIKNIEENENINSTKKLGITLEELKMKEEAYVEGARALLCMMLNEYLNDVE